MSPVSSLTRETRRGSPSGKLRLLANLSLCTRSLRMYRAALRSVPRSLPARSYQQQLHTATTSTAQRRFAVYQSQTTNSFVYASVGLAALLGWTAAILTVGGRGSKHGKKDVHAVKKGESSHRSNRTDQSAGIAGRATTRGRLHWVLRRETVHRSRRRRAGRILARDHSCAVEWHADFR